MHTVHVHTYMYTHAYTHRRGLFHVAIISRSSHLDTNISWGKFFPGTCMLQRKFHHITKLFLLVVRASQGVRIGH